MVVKFSSNLSRIVLFIYNFPYGAHLYRLEQRELGTPFHKMDITVDDVIGKNSQQHRLVWLLPRSF